MALVAAAVLLAAALDGSDLRPVQVVLAGPLVLLLISVTAARQVVPSVRLVLVGLAASVAAMVVATRAHRNQAGHPDVQT